MHIVMTKSESLSVLVDCLDQLGFAKKIGMAPMNRLERVLQSLLESGSMDE